jgi:hypothetical protein
MAYLNARDGRFAALSALLGLDLQKTRPRGERGTS